jgi:erythromycin esterase-like protein
MGAIAGGEVMVVNDDVVRGLDVPPEALERVAGHEARELARQEQDYREGRAMVDVARTTVVVVDDGLATGAGMRAAIQSLHGLRPAQIVVAVPAAPVSTCQELSAVVDDVVCATTPSPFLATGQSYWDFTETTDDEVRTLLRAAVTSRSTATSMRRSTARAAVRSDTVAAPNGMADAGTLRHLVGDARFVLIGEASHGTHEFAATRADMTRGLIEDLGFCAVAVEADWPDAYRVDRFVRGRSDDADAEQALRGFARFPAWVWRNTVAADFVAWLRERNDRIGNERGRAGFYGLDLYSRYRSIEQVIAHLDRVDPAAAARAREVYTFGEHAASDGGPPYGHVAAFGAGESCEQELIERLVELQRRTFEDVARDGLSDDVLVYGHDAAAASAAESYYRTMFAGHVPSWNLRDRHMADTLETLADHLTQQRGRPARIVVWAHNSHVGDARATEQASRGELTLGQLTRRRHRDDTLLLGFTTTTGTVAAADHWGGPAERRRVRMALPDSVEGLLHDMSEPSLLLRFDAAPRARDVLRSARLERDIGVVYRPATERRSHYFRARVADQFDVVVHVDHTQAIEPLEPTAGWKRDELAEISPSAM